jgi:hypothetical protein
MVPIIGSRMFNKKRGPEGPLRSWRFSLFALVVVAVLGVGWQGNQPAVDRKGLQLYVEAIAFLVRESCTDLGPAFAGLAVALIFLNREYVEVGGGRCLCRRSGAGGLHLIAIVHFNTPNLDVWTFIAPEIRSDGEEIRQRKSAERTWDVE